MPASPYIGRGSEHLTFWVAKLRDPTFVYVIQGPERDTPIKVGFARDVMARIATLQTGNPVDLRLLHVVPGEQRLEWFLHQRLKGARLRGEWFKPGQVMDRFLQYVSDLADWMVEQHDGSCYPPNYVNFDPLRFTKRVRKHEVAVRWVEPDPVMSREEVEAMRAQKAIPPAPLRTNIDLRPSEHDVTAHSPGLPETQPGDIWRHYRSNA